MLHDDIEKVLFSEEVIRKRCQELGAEITEAYAGKPIHCICVLKGAFVFASDVFRCIEGDVTIDFMAVSSYGASTRSSGTVRIQKDLQTDLMGLHTLVVEDIVDTGLTLKFLLSHLESHKPASVKVCTLLSKPSQRQVEVPIDFCGFEVPNEFVVGYGLDFDQRYRCLPYIGVLAPKAYQG
jgi:hypoxanthine phosphoribosyltransferase